MRVCWLLVMLGAGCGAAFAGVGEWKTYTAKREVRSSAVIGSRIWVATGGGVFAFSPGDKSYQEFTTSEGLRTIDVTALTGDDRGTVWIGASNGLIHRYTPPTGTWEYISDIAILNNPQKQINRLEVSGDTLLVSSDVGLSIYSVSRGEFGDTYERFGVSPAQLVGNVLATARDSSFFWVATRAGVARTPRSNPNLSEPSSWQVFTTGQGLPSNTVTGLALAGRLYASTSNGLAVYRDSVWQTVPGSVGKKIAGLAAEDPDRRSVLFVTPTEAWRVTGADGSDPQISRLFSDPSITLSGVDRSGILGTLTRGVLVPKDTLWTPVSPDGPPSNRFIGLAVDGRGAIWSGTGIRNGDGIMGFDGATWRSYTTQSMPSLGSNDYYKVSLGVNNTKWVSSWGAGVALLDDGGTLQRVFNASNGLPPSVDPAFVVVGGVATDRFGVTWITNRTGRGDTSLVRVQPDASLSYIIGCGFGCRTRNPDNVFTDVTIDQYGTKWFSNYSRFETATPLGFYYLNETAALPGTTGGWGRLSTADGLTSDKVYSTAVDRDGELWVGSDQGISIIFDPSNPRGRIAPYHPLRDQIIQAIVVDPLNNKWIATKQGVFILSNDGTMILDHYTFENTSGKLLDNDVASIALDPKSGLMYFGTEHGLSSITTAAITPNRSFEELTLSPNPFVVPSPSPLLIDGLVQGSSIKVFSIDGSLVRELRSPGGRVGFWDGRDGDDNVVSTGIYLIVAYSDDGTKVTKTKVAVVHR